MPLPPKIPSGQNLRVSVVNTVNAIIGYLREIAVAGDNSTIAVQRTPAGLVIKALPQGAARRQTPQNGGGETRIVSLGAPFRMISQEDWDGQSSSVTKRFYVTGGLVYNRVAWSSALEGAELLAKKTVIGGTFATGALAAGSYRLVLTENGFFARAATDLVDYDIEIPGYFERQIGTFAVDSEGTPAIVAQGDCSNIHLHNWGLLGQYCPVVTTNPNVSTSGVLLSGYPLSGSSFKMRYSLIRMVVSAVGRTSPNFPCVTDFSAADMGGVYDGTFPTIDTGALSSYADWCNSLNLFVLIELSDGALAPVVTSSWRSRTPATVGQYRRAFSVVASGGTVYLHTDAPMSPVVFHRGDQPTRG